jgi:16S rRNA (cytosine967-C5)-methyltransferase
MGDTGTIVAADVRGRRLDLLSRTVAESGARRVQVIQANARGSPSFRDIFDAVLVDAPCSGLGTIRRDPDVRWRRTEADLAPLAEAQREMLTQAATAVQPGGRLIYSTCSSEPEENEDVVRAFLSTHPEFRRGRPALFDRRPELAALLDDEGSLKTLPFRDELEAFYTAMLIRVC